MSRPKGDPEIRRSEFIKAAQGLFFTNGYKGVSIQEILTAVGERSVSPSVFYYYFKSKEALYQAVMENYCDEYMVLMEHCFSDENIPVEKRFMNALDVMSKTITESMGSVNESSSIDNRLFALGLRDRTTRKIGEMMAETLIKYPMSGKSAAAKKRMSMFITGGVSEIINHIIFNSQTTNEEMKQIIKEIMQYSANVIGIPGSVLRRLTKRK